MKKIFLVTSDQFAASREIMIYLQSRFAVIDDPEAADIIFALGGDGTMLSAIRAHWRLGKPFCGINFGHIGFLLNSNEPKILEEIAEGDYESVENRMLAAQVFRENDNWQEYALNDFYFRGDYGMAKIKVAVDGQYETLACDGVIVSSAAGSTAYNAASHGAILPIGTANMVLTGISTAVYHGFRTAQLSAETKITLEPTETDKRATSFYADGIRMRGIVKAQMTLSQKKVYLLYAKSENYRQKVQSLQFPGWKK